MLGQIRSLLRLSCNSSSLHAVRRDFKRPGYNIDYNIVKIKHDPVSNEERNIFFERNAPGAGAPFTLSEGVILSICNGDESKRQKINSVLMELYVRDQKGELLPNKLNLFDFKLMLNHSFSQRSRRLATLKRKEMSIINMKEEKKTARQNLELERKSRDERQAEEKWLDYHLFGNALFPRIHNTGAIFADLLLCQAVMHGQSLVFDCSYADVMTEPEVRATARQIVHSVAINSLYKQPFAIYLCNLKTNSLIYEYLTHLNPKMVNRSGVICSEKSYTDFFPRQKLVYLSPHAKRDVKYDTDQTFVIGAMVDRNDNSPHSLYKAKESGVYAAKFPIDKYLKWKAGSKSLCLNQVLSILIEMKETGSWAKAVLKAVPPRKIHNSSDKDRENLSSKHLHRAMLQ